MLFLGGSNVGITDPTRTTGQPPSGNNASSQYLIFDPEFGAEITVNVEVLATPSQSKIVNWLIQTEFLDDSGSSLDSAGTGFFGLRFAPTFPNSRAIVCAASSAFDGSELTGPESPLPSATGEPQVRTYGWVTGRKYLLRIYSYAGWQWRFEVTDTVTSVTSIVRDISIPGGSIVRGAVLYTEAFTDCQIQSSVRWSNLQFAAPDESDLITPTSAVAAYQTYPEGGCTNGNQIASGGGVVQATGVPRTTPHNSTITITPSFAALTTTTATGAALSWNPVTDYLRAGNAGPYVSAAQAGVTSSLTAIGGTRSNITVQVILWRPSDGQWPTNASNFAREWTKFTFDELRNDLTTWGFIATPGALTYTWDQVTVHQVTSTRLTVQEVLDAGDNDGDVFSEVAADVDDQIAAQKPMLRMVWAVTGRPHPGATDGSWDIQWLAAATTAWGDNLTRHLEQPTGSARFYPTVIEPTKDLTVTGDDYYWDADGYRATGPSWLWGREYRFVSIHELLHTLHVPHMIRSLGDVGGGYMTGDRTYPSTLEPISAVLAYSGAMWGGRGMPPTGVYPAVNAAATLTRAERVGDKIWQFAGGFASSRHLTGIAFKVADPTPDGSDYNRARYHLGEFNGGTATWTVTVKEHRPWAVYNDLIFLHYDGLSVVPLLTSPKVLPA
jgi:hypothetical protein